MALTLPLLEKWLSGKLLGALSLLAAGGNTTGRKVHVMASTGNPSGRFTGAGSTDICVYYQIDATSNEDAIWLLLSGSSTWTRLSTLSDLQLAPTSDVTLTAGGAATLTGAVHTIRGAGGIADDCDTLSGMTSAELAFLVTGAEAITYRDGIDNIITSGGASIVTAAGDVVLAFLSGTAVRVHPILIAAGIPVGTIKLTSGKLLWGSAGNKAEEKTLSAHGATPCTGSAVGNHAQITITSRADRRSRQ